MKKIIVSLAALTISLSMSAITPTASAAITLTGDVSGDNDMVRLVESTTDGFTDGFESGYDVDQPVANVPGIYAICGGGTYRFATSMTNNLDNNPIGVKTGTDTEYTMSFSSVTGRTIVLYDIAASTATTLANGDEYHFSAAANSTIEDRFIINMPIAAGNLETCFTGTELQIANNPFWGKVIITNNSTSAVHEYAYKASDTIDMSEPGEYPDGDYTVQVGTGANIRKFIVTVKH